MSEREGLIEWKVFKPWRMNKLLVGGHVGTPGWEKLCEKKGYRQESLFSMQFSQGPQLYNSQSNFSYHKYLNVIDYFPFKIFYHSYFLPLSFN